MYESNEFHLSDSPSPPASAGHAHGGHGTACGAPELEVLFDDDGIAAMGLTETLSPDGVFVATCRPRPVGSSVRLSFILPRSGGRVELVADVRAVRPGDRERGVPPGMEMTFGGASDASTYLRAIVEGQAWRAR